MNDMMTFPDTWEEFEKSYGFTDNEEVYTNGARIIPSFRVKQWLDHLSSVQQEQLDCEDCVKHGGDWECDRVHCHKGDVPDTNVGELISRQAAIDVASRECHEWRGIFSDIEQGLKELLPVQPRKGKWNNHTVACLLADMFGDTCACNFNGIDEWLPQKCELVDSCPNTVGVACWEQFLTHREDMREGDAE